MAYDQTQFGAMRYNLAGLHISEITGSPAGFTAPSTDWSAPTRPPPVSPKKQPETYIAIGIDFGTTYSGVSWAFSGDPENICEVSRWPCHERRGQDEVQIPTQIDLQTRKWGYLIPRTCDPIRWFKLLLLNPDDTQDDVKNSDQLKAARAKLRGAPGSEAAAVVDLIAEFLRNLWKHALKDIGKEMDIDALPLKVALTVPAIWPNYAREKMKEAARKAGILDPRGPIGKTTLILVEEPEAAAICTLFDRRKYPEIVVGETFIVCDCGGGTVDIISYTVKSLEPFSVGEAVKGAGKLCGAFLVDQAFENYMKIKSGLKFDKCDETDFRAFVNDEWEYTMKRNFGIDEDQDTFVIRPPAKAVGALKKIRNHDSFRLSKDAIKQFYMRTYSGVRELISQQRDRILAETGKPFKKILLVGGLGASPYIHTMLNEQYGNVFQPRRAWSAVARGAVIKVLKSAHDPSTATEQTTASLLTMPSVVSRVSRFSYGVELGDPVPYADPPADRTRDTFYTEPDGIERVRRMTWYLRQNETVTNKAPVAYDFSRYLLDRSQLASALPIYTSDAEGAPPCRRDATVKQMCIIRYEIGRAWEDLPTIRDPGGTIFRRSGSQKLTMSFDGEVKWALKAGANTVEQDVNVEYMGA